MPEIKFIDVAKHSQYLEYIDELLEKLHMSNYQRILKGLEDLSREQIAFELYQTPLHFLQVQKKLEREKESEEYIQKLKEGNQEDLREHIRKLAQSDSMDDDDDDDDDINDSDDGFSII